MLHVLILDIELCFKTCIIHSKYLFNIYLRFPNNLVKIPKYLLKLINICFLQIFSQYF